MGVEGGRGLIKQPAEGDLRARKVPRIFVQAKSLISRIDSFIYSIIEKVGLAGCNRDTLVTTADRKISISFTLWLKDKGPQATTMSLLPAALQGPRFLPPRSASLPGTAFIRPAGGPLLGPRSPQQDAEVGAVWKLHESSLRPAGCDVHSHTQLQCLRF